MAYQRINFENKPSKKSPISAENLNHMEQGISDAHVSIADIEAYKANSIICSTKGKTILITDSANVPLKNLKVYGDSTQKQYEGNQLFDASRMPTTTSGNVTITNNGNGSLTVSGTGAATNVINVKIEYTHEETIELVKSGTLTLLVSQLTKPYCYVHFYYDNNNKRADITCHSSTKISTEITEEMLDDTCRMIIGIFGYAGDEIISGTVKLMLYQDGDGTWEPYTGGKASPSMEYPQPIESVENAEIKLYGKNLYDKDSDFTNYFYNETTNIITSGSGFKSRFVNVDGISNVNISIKSTLKSDNLFWALVDGNTVGSNVINSGAITFGSNSNVDVSNGKYLMISVRNDEYEPQIIETVQIELGSVATEYEPYKEPQTLTIPYVLRKGDNVEYATGKRTQARNRLVFDGTESWSLGYGTGDGVNNRFELELKNANFKKDTPYHQLGVKSNAFIYEITGGIPSVNCFRIYLDGDIAYPLFNPSTDIIPLDDLDAWKTYLAEQYANGTPVYIEYELAEPIETDLTDAEIQAYNALHMNYPNTTIVNDGGALMEVEYVCDTKEYIKQNYVSKEAHQEHENRIAELEKAIVNS